MQSDAFGALPAQNVFGEPSTAFVSRNNIVNWTTTSVNIEFKGKYNLFATVRYGRNAIESRLFVVTIDGV
jgi:hypothetical protein